MKVAAQLLQRRATLPRQANPQNCPRCLIFRPSPRRLSSAETHSTTGKSHGGNETAWNAEADEDRQIRSRHESGYPPVPRSQGPRRGMRQSLGCLRVIAVPCREGPSKKARCQNQLRGSSKLVVPCRHEVLGGQRERS